MGQKSIKANKNIYQLSREAAGHTRESASEVMEYISASRIEKIESEKQSATPEDIIAMAKCYKDPGLCNYYCTHDCALGKAYVPEIKSKPLSQITLDVLASLNKLSTEKDRLIEISLDGDITEDEYEDFSRIQERLNQMSLAIDTMQLWIDKKIGNGRFNGNLTTDQ